jgi:hypothetical protein
VAREALHEGHLRGILAASTFLRLTDCQQRRLVAEARRSGNPITLRRTERAAAQTDLRRQAAARPGVPQPSTAVSAVRCPGTPGSATAAASLAAQLRTAADSLAAQLPAAAASPAAPSPASSAVPAAALSAGAAPAFCQRCRAAMSEPAPERRSGRAAERGKRLQLLPAPPPPVALRRPRVDGPWITLEITGQQLERLVVLLGKRPAPSARAQVEQLLACL